MSNSLLYRLLRLAPMMPVVVLVACGGTRVAETSAGGSPGAGRATDQATSEHVVVVSVDGLRPDAIARFGATTMQRLMREGAYTLRARTVLPSKTLPAHASMLTGVEPADHGLTWNEDETALRGYIQVPTVFGVAREGGLHTAGFFAKGKLRHLQPPGSLGYAATPPGSGRFSGEQVAERVRAYLGANRPNLVFVHLSDPDFAGHLSGWMGWHYGRNVRKADQALATVLRAADGAFGAANYTVIVTSDHGGHGRDHGSVDARDVTIPWIAWGKGVRAGGAVPDGVRTMDTAATVLWLLNVTPPAGIDGVPVAGAFR